MNGGVLHACECLGAKELSASEAGYRFFGFNSVGDLLNRARRVAEAGKDLEAHEAQLDREYAALIPSDSHIAEPFEIYFCANPGDFAPR